MLEQTGRDEAARRDGDLGGVSPRAEASGPPVPPRLLSLVERIWSHPVAIIVAPPGSGKTTLMSAFARRASVPFAYYHADDWDASEASIVSRLATACSAFFGGDRPTWSTMRDLVAGLEQVDARQALLILDDIHVLEGTQALDGIEQLLTRIPPNLHVLIASRTRPSLPVSKLYLQGDVLQIGADDLRLRAWEVEHLFRDYYRQSMVANEVARLARWTEGWVAGLQLFHLATRERTTTETRRILRALGPSSRIAHEYLAQNALDGLSPRLRRFAIDTSVLGRLSESLCDTMLASSDSAEVLDELGRCCLFLTQPEPGSYRYHEVFRSHLQSVLRNEIGERRMLERFREAGDLLVHVGAVAEAVEAYARAESWEMVDQVLADVGPQVAASRPPWLDSPAHTERRADPWLALAGARRLRSEGQFRDAIRAYRLIEQSAASHVVGETAARERIALNALLEPSSGPTAVTSEWWGVVCHAVAGHPSQAAAIARRSDGPQWRVAESLSLLLAGRLAEARRAIDGIEVEDDIETPATCVAAILDSVVAGLCGEAQAQAKLVAAIGAAEGLGLDWLARLARSLQSLSGQPLAMSEAQRIHESALEAGDHWIAGTCGLARTWGALRAVHGGTPVEVYSAHLQAATSARRSFHELGVPLLEALSEAVAAMADRIASGPRSVVDEPSSLGVSAMVGQDGVRIPTESLLQASRRGDIPASESLVGDMVSMLVARRWHGSPSHRPDQLDGVRSVEPDAPAVLRVLGGFSLQLEGELVDLTSTRPRVRTLLYLLAASAATPLHREVIMEALWPDTPPGSTTRSLHVAISTLRSMLEPAASRNTYRLVRRIGESYQLSLPAGSWFDVARFREAMSEARTAWQRGDVGATISSARQSVEAYGGALLPEVGPAEWAVGQRDTLQREASEAATLLATALMEKGDYRAAIAACTAGLDRDRFDDELWRLRIAAHQASGDVVAAKAARVSYRETLMEVGAEAPA